MPDRKQTQMISKYKKLISDLEAHPDVIMHTETPIKNRDILNLIKLSNTMSKSQAIQFAVEFTINNCKGEGYIEKQKMSSLERKLEKLRYGEDAARESSNDLIDSAKINNLDYPGKLKF